MNKINKSLVASAYVRLKFALKGINTFEPPKSLQFSLLTESMQNLSIIAAVMANHKTQKNDQVYNYNFWEFKVPEFVGDFLICVCMEQNEGELKFNGYFVFPKKLISRLSKKSTINIFESDVSGLYSREPKINKNFYFQNWKLLIKNESQKCEL